MPLVAAAAITAGGAILSSNSASKAASKAAAAGQAATDAATAEQRRQYDQSRADYAPYLQIGTGALQKLGGLYGLQAAPQVAAPQAQYGQTAGRLGYGSFPEIPTGQIGTGQVGAAQPVPAAGQQPQAGNMSGFFASPDYQFRLNESLRALTARNAALGIQDSGAARRSALGLAGNLASGEFNNYANRLAALAGVGQTTAQNNAALGQAYAGNVGNLQMSNAQNLGSSYNAQSQAQQSLYGNLAGIGSGLIGQMWPVKK